MLSTLNNKLHVQDKFSHTSNREVIQWRPSHVYVVATCFGVGDSSSCGVLASNYYMSFQNALSKYVRISLGLMKENKEENVFVSNENKTLVNDTQERWSYVILQKMFLNEICETNNDTFGLTLNSPHLLWQDLSTPPPDILLFDCPLQDWQTTTKECWKVWDIYLQKQPPNNYLLHSLESYNDTLYLSFIECKQYLSLITQNHETAINYSRHNPNLSWRKIVRED
jgi:hypothetical protein